MQLPLDQRPRATGAVCVLQDDTAWFAHVGDSRIYHLRAGKVVSRTRDHSHVELLLQEGLINANQAMNHPMRNFVESCLGGDPLLPEMHIGRTVRVQTGGHSAGLHGRILVIPDRRRHRGIALYSRAAADCACRRSANSPSGAAALPPTILLLPC